jgi:hypothetical protein
MGRIGMKMNRSWQDLYEEFCVRDDADDVCFTMTLARPPSRTKCLPNEVIAVLKLYT